VGRGPARQAGHPRQLVSVVWRCGSWESATFWAAACAARCGRGACTRPELRWNGNLVQWVENLVSDLRRINTGAKTRGPLDLMADCSADDATRGTGGTREAKADASY